MNEPVRVLNVDDDEVARYVKHRILAAAGYQVIDARDGREALEALRSASPQVALVDMKLPDISGFELTRRIRRHPGSAALPVIQISAICVTRDDERDGLDSGADAYLMVPFEGAQLTALVGELIQRNGVEPSGEPLPKARVRRVDAYIRANMEKSISIDDLASAAGLSPFYFCRMFKRATGVTPHEHLMVTRIEEAARLLVTTRLSMAEIAKRVGFRTQAHFSAAFKRRKGVAPRAFRAGRAGF